jgi:non-heme chloroperoxidase
MAAGRHTPGARGHGRSVPDACRNDGNSFRKALDEARSQFYLDLSPGPFHGHKREEAKVSQGLVQDWWRQDRTGSAKAHYDFIEAFSETDFT